jgi:hypothetical protein
MMLNAEADDLGKWEGLLSGNPSWPLRKQIRI